MNRVLNLMAIVAFIILFVGCSTYHSAEDTVKDFFEYIINGNAEAADGLILGGSDEISKIFNNETLGDSFVELASSIKYTIKSVENDKDTSDIKYVTVDVAYYKIFDDSNGESFISTIKNIFGAFFSELADDDKDDSFSENLTMTSKEIILKVRYNENWKIEWNNELRDVLLCNTGQIDSVDTLLQKIIGKIMQ